MEGKSTECKIVSVSKETIGEEEFWTFKVMDDDGIIYKLPSLKRYFPVSLIPPVTFYCNNESGEENNKIVVEVHIPRIEMIEALSNSEIYNGKKAIVKIYGKDIDLIDYRAKES